MSPMEKLLLIMERLRDPETGCPWDLKQTYRSIAPHTVEEVYEVVDAIENGSTEDLADELGDLLFQVVFYAQLGTEAGDFDFDRIADNISGKLIRRHPHVFPGGNINAKVGSDVSADQVVANWEEIKKHEKGENQEVSALDNVPLALPALTRSAKLQKKAAAVGFDWQDVRPVLDKLKEEVAELEQAMEAGDSDSVRDELADVIFSAVNLGRHYKIDSESALRQGNDKFEKRFRHMEAIITEKGLSFSDLELDDLEVFWQQSKKELSDTSH